MTSPAVLLIDAGSSRLKWAWWREGRLSDAADFAHQGEVTAAVAQMAVERMPERILLASVLDEPAEKRLQGALLQRFGIQAESARSVAECRGVRNGYLDPAQLGVDRWLALIAAHRPGRRTLVVDCGTAVTLDAVDASGQHLGGQIMPGLKAMGDALRMSTRLRITAAEPVDRLGRDTASCVAAGIHNAIGALIDRGNLALGGAEHPPRVIITGGDAACIARFLESRAELRPLLVLEGLALQAGLSVDP